jgi:hypothetical protein
MSELWRLGGKSVAKLYVALGLRIVPYLHTMLGESCEFWVGLSASEAQTAIRNRRVPADAGGESAVATYSREASAEMYHTNNEWR